jgi:hypothetical protein
MERIDPIRPEHESPWVAPTGATRPVGRRHPDEQDGGRKRRPPQREPQADGHPDADGHVDVSV